MLPTEVYVCVFKLYGWLDSAYLEDEVVQRLADLVVLAVERIGEVVGPV